MADTVEMRRLMLHAANLLDAQEPGEIADAVARYATLPGPIAAARESATAQAVANGVASTVLRMVAAALADEPEPAAKRPAEGGTSKDLTNSVAVPSVPQEDTDA